MNLLREMKVSASADTVCGKILAFADLAAPPERVFQALSSPEITAWWERPGVFDTREWSGDVRVGGTFRASGIGRGQPYVLEGDFIEVERPRRLVHTWRPANGNTTVVTYALTERDGSTRLTLEHAGFSSADCCEATATGWQTSLEILARMLSAP